MKTVTTTLQDKFSCIADKCPKTCCSGWQIVIDDNSYERYDSYEGPMKQVLEDNVDWDEGCFCQKDNKDCAFLNKSGLCNMILDMGEDMLCDTCRLYPRHVEEYEGVREWSVSMSCPEIARMMVEDREEIELNVVEDDEEEPFEEDYDDYDFFLYTNLEETREILFDIIRNKEYDIYTKMGLLLELARILQGCYDKDETFTMNDQAIKFAEGLNNKDISGYRLNPEDISKVDFEVMMKLERLDDKFDELLELNKSFSGLAREKFIAEYNKEDYEKIMENILFSMIYTYYLGAVYNGMIYGYVAMCVFATAMVDILSAAMKAENPEMKVKEILIRVLYLYSRETEHSDDNINALLEYFDSKCQ